MMKKIIFDTDPGVDDAMALLFAHRHPDLELLGITTIFGNGDIDTVTRNARYLKKLYGIEAPVARGAGRAFGVPPGPSPAIVHGDNGLGNVDLDETDLPPADDRPAHVLISDITRDHPGEVTLVAVGRMTNLAIALAHDPDIVNRVKNVVIMGGAFAFAGPNGNVSPAGEANIAGDPHAADQVFGAEWPLTAIGLDVTRKVILPETELARFASDGGVPGEFISRIKTHYMRFHDRYGIEGCFVHDSTAIAFVIAPELFKLRRGPVRVATEGVACGMTLQRDPDIAYGPTAWDGRPDQDVAIDVAGEKVLDLIVETITAQGR